jgi:mono/diheme cytochrome c family protein
VRIAGAIPSVLVGVILLLGDGSAAAPPGPPTGLDVAPNVLQRGLEVYGTQCAVCHGALGDGNGMAAHMLRVQPRDFRRGLFKFRSTPSGSLPTDDDLLRTVTEGVRWTGMVGRADLWEGDRRAVVQYLKTFSPRFAAERPASAVAVPPAPEKNSALLDQGRRLYRDADCAKCHGPLGRGDGSSAAGMKDDWGWPTWPSDLTWRPLKRGFSPDGIYLTITTGLSGTPMPSYGDSLESQEIWALVYYLDSLVPPEHRLSPRLALGEESRGWMAVRMGRMMGPGGMMHGMGSMPMMR